MLEYIRGGSIFSAVYSDKYALNYSEIKKIALSLAKAINYLHLRGVIHRDLKLENILLSENGTIKLADFGWSIHCHRNQQRETFCGTVIYLSPEICNKELYTKAVDVWSYGVVLYELFYQCSPFGKSTEAETMAAIKDCPLEFPDNSLITPEAMDLISQCLDKSHETRVPIDKVLEHSFFGNQEKAISSQNEYMLRNEADPN